jgi:hypothetical protein
VAALTELAWLIMSSLIREAAFGATGNSQAALDKWEADHFSPFFFDNTSASSCWIRPRWTLCAAGYA